MLLYRSSSILMLALLLDAIFYKRSMSFLNCLWCRGSLNIHIKYVVVVCCQMSFLMILICEVSRINVFNWLQQLLSYFYCIIFTNKHEIVMYILFFHLLMYKLVSKLLKFVFIQYVNNLVTKVLTNLNV